MSAARTSRAGFVPGSRLVSELCPLRLLRLCRHKLSASVTMKGSDPTPPRAPISRDLQVDVFRRDGWICRWCGRPVIFAPALKYLEEFARNEGFGGPLAYHDPRWRRDRAPLLDHLGAVIDHVEAHSRGGSADAENFVTSCNKCNTRKSDTPVQDFTRRLPAHRIKSRYGEPQHWDGLSTIFTILVQRQSANATASERNWLRALNRGLAQVARESLAVDPPSSV